MAVLDAMNEDIAFAWPMGSPLLAGEKKPDRLHAGLEQSAAPAGRPAVVVSCAPLALLGRLG